MKRALITGATGFVGGYLVRALVARGTEVCCLVRPSSNRTQFDGLPIAFAEGDVTDLDSLQTPVADADVVFHLAAYLKAPWADAFHTINVGGTENVAKACAEAGHRPTLIILSTMAAAGPRMEEVLVETLPDAPVSIYGKTKREAEQRAIEYAGVLPITIVRPPGVFGDGDPSLSSLFPALRRGFHVVTGTGEQKLSFIHAADLAIALILAAENGERVPEVTEEREPGRGYYIISDETPISFVDLGRVLARAIGRDALRIFHIPRWLFWCIATCSECWARLRGQKAFLNRDKAREGLGGDWVCDVSKAREQLGFSPAMPLHAKLAQTIREASPHAGDPSAS